MKCLAILDTKSIIQNGVLVPSGLEMKIGKLH